ncbi:MAG: hypothetical protein EXR64_04335 [Dehalococcoidia bacterium]|nr:hypothetical protein [Dehalococcoidia bacterium]
MRDEIDYLEQRGNHRAALIRRALLLTPTALAATGLFFYSVQFLPGSLFPVIIITLCALAVDFEAIATLRDLRAQPTTTRGRVDRLWRKSRYLFLGRVDYMLIGRLLFEIGPIAASELRPGDEVVVEHWPHTTIVISLGRTGRGESAR